MSEIVVSFPGSSSASSNAPTTFEQSQAVTPTGSFWTFVSQSFAEYLQVAVANAALMTAPVALAADAGTLDAEDIAEIIGQRAQRIPSFEAVYVVGTDWGFECVTVLNNATDDELFLLYDLELEFRQEMPDLRFYFEIIDREDRPLRDIRTLDMYDGVFDSAN